VVEIPLYKAAATMMNESFMNVEIPLYKVKKTRNSHSLHKTCETSSGLNFKKFLTV
jgi:hypothetical protein